VAPATCLGQATPTITGVVNDATFTTGGGISPDSWLAIFGTNLAPAGDSRKWNEGTEIINGKLPISLDGTSVTLNGKPATVEFIQPSQVNIQAPDDTAGWTGVGDCNNGNGNFEFIHCQSCEVRTRSFPCHWQAGQRDESHSQLGTLAYARGSVGFKTATRDLSALKKVSAGAQSRALGQKGTD
jgi:hypothetical protein